MSVCAVDMPSPAVFGQQLGKVLSHDRSITEKASLANQNRLTSSSLSSTSDMHISMKMSSLSSASDVQVSTKISSMSSASDVHVSTQSSPSPPPQLEPLQETDNIDVKKRPYLLSLPRSASMDCTSTPISYTDCGRDYPTDDEKKLRTRSDTERESTILHLTAFQSAMTALTQTVTALTDIKPEIQLSPSLMRRRKSSAPDGTCSSGLYEAITLSPVVDHVTKDDEKLLAYSPLPTQVPLIMSRSIKFLEEHGLYPLSA